GRRRCHKQYPGGLFGQRYLSFGDERTTTVLHNAGYARCSLAEDDHAREQDPEEKAHSPHRFTFHRISPVTLIEIGFRVHTSINPGETVCQDILCISLHLFHLKWKLECWRSYCVGFGRGKKTAAIAATRLPVDDSVY